jgi:uncharacterized membrane protein
MQPGDWFIKNTRGASHALAAIVIGLAGISAATAQTLYYRVTDLGEAPGQYTGCFAIQLNDRADVVGTCSSAASGRTARTEAVVWRNGTLSGLGVLTGGTSSEARAINSLGAITGISDTGDGRPQGWVTTATAGALLNIFPNSGNTRTQFIGNTGWIGGYYIKGGTAFKPAIWTPDQKDPLRYRVTDLPVLPGINSKFTSSIPQAFNQSGQAAGWASNDVIGQHAAFWNNDAKHSIVDLGVLPGDWTSLAWGMNDLGQAVGESNGPVNGLRPIVWSNDAEHTPHALPLLPGDNYGTAYGISDAGHVIGISANLMPGTRFGPGTPRRYVVWRDGGVYELQSLLEPVTGAGWTNVGASAINSLGQIVAQGALNGVYRAILLTPLP